MVATLRLGYWAAQEQYDPQRLLQYAVHAEVVGFDIIVTSDHFHPWGDTGQAGFPWIWMASAAEKTRKVEVGTAVTTPLFRYHPAIVAQGFATLDNLYPGRIFLTIGTGHAMNERPLGYPWPEGFEEKVGRLQESLEIIQKLWGGDFVTYDGKYYHLDRAKLYTKPKTKIPIYLATSNERVARLAGQFADGILTNPRGLERFRKIVNTMERSAIKLARDPTKLSKSMEFKVAYDIDYNRALKSAMFWATTAIPKEKREQVWDPRELQALVGPEEEKTIKDSWLITTDSDDIIKRLGEFLKMGFDRVYIHSASPIEERFLNLLGREILPWMREYYESLFRPVRTIVVE
ncbi:MAG TPA: TIGR03557 family F420-dependent LLM class oxidoreductase [Candidatus Acidoferrales bacterium]|nr:TIGR03557 family F420-dependent LLM class oxidoreductase [Candidatus Acidoferrales bacterium]